jgi:carbonic anhydrase/acetyltransferase-like protein (isoleucine patch superfamily)
LHRDEVEIAASAWVAPSAVLEGRVRLRGQVSIWHGCVLRGDSAPIEIGESSNVQDGSVIHVDVGYPARIGRRVLIGHRAVVHGCQIDDDAMIGMGAVVLTGARIHTGAVVAAGAVVREGYEVPAGTMVGGVPAKPIGLVNEEMKRRIAFGIRHYQEATAERLRGSD